MTYKYTQSILSKFLFNLLIFGLMFLTLIGHAAAKPLHKNSMLLARCEFIYSYGAQFMQLNNNLGATQALLRRAALITTASMMLNEDKGVIASWKIKEFTLATKPLKYQLDSRELDIFDEVTKCDRAAIPIASALRENSTTLWGKTFDELHDMFYEKMKKFIGL